MTQFNDFLRRARESLADLYPEVERARLLVLDAGLRQAGIDLSGEPLVFWQRILEAAHRSGKMDKLLEIAVTQVPADDVLRSLCDEYPSLITVTPMSRETSPVAPGPSMALRSALRQAMVDRLDIEDVRAACFDLGVQAQNLGGSTKGALVIGLIELLDRWNRSVDLVAWLRGNRPDHVWPDPYAIPDEAHDRAEAVSQPSVQPKAQEQGAPAPSRAVTADPLVIESPIHLELVRVPAGEFLMGSDGRKDRDAYDEEKPQHRVHLPEFLIGKYPVTAEQFAAFAKATGYQGKANTDVRTRADHPVTWVSWYDAVAFCRWLSVTTGRSFRLPTEAEWEKAARATDGRLYPWGDEAPDERRCNFDNNIGDMTPVGKYPAGASPYGALDMAGNVWEWTGTIYQLYPHDRNDGRKAPVVTGTEFRVVRGCAFDLHARNLRCASRDGSLPDNAYGHLGFRVVTLPAIHDAR